MQKNKKKDEMLRAVKLSVMAFHLGLFFCADFVSRGVGVPISELFMLPCSKIHIHLKFSMAITVQFCDDFLKWGLL